MQETKNPPRHPWVQTFFADWGCPMLNANESMDDKVDPNAVKSLACSKNTSNLTIEHHLDQINPKFCPRLTILSLGIVIVIIMAISGLVSYSLINDRLAMLDQIDELNSRINEFKEEATFREIQMTQLNSQLDKFSIEVFKLENENQQFLALNEQLVATTQKYQELNSELNTTASRLQNMTNGLSVTNDELVEINADLSTVTSFLNETARDVESSYNDIAAFLSEQISINRDIMLKMIENTYSQRTSTWDCDVHSKFSGKEFLRYSDSPIGDSYTNQETGINDLLDYINVRVLRPLCLSQPDFETFLASTYISGGHFATISFNDLSQGVVIYTSAAFEYYFPDEDLVDIGLSIDDWSSASYDCNTLAVPFFYNI